MMPGVNNPFPLYHTLTTTHGTSTDTNNTVIAFRTTLLTRIEDGKIMKRNNYTCTAIDKGRSFLTDLESRSGY